jgi:hypothetical protein
MNTEDEDPSFNNSLDDCFSDCGSQEDKVSSLKCCSCSETYPSNEPGSSTAMCAGCSFSIAQQFLADDNSKFVINFSSCFVLQY